MNAERQLAHVNVAVLKYPHGDSRVQPFFDAVPQINALAEASPGFVWRETDAGEEARAAALFGEPNLAIALSVWRDIESLYQFVYRSMHARFLRRRADWFVPTWSVNKALWWVPVGHRPGMVEAKHRLDWLSKHGSGEIAFGFSEQGRKGRDHAGNE